MRKRAAGVVIAAALAVLALAATVWARTPPEHGYVTSSLSVPATNAQAMAYGRDINGDGHVDNALGQLFASLAGSGIDLQSGTTDAIQGGQLLMLHSLRTPSFYKAKKVTWQVLFAKPTATPDFSGKGTFAVDPAGLNSTRLKATIRKHHVQTASGPLPVLLDIGGVFTLRVLKGVIFATCTPTRCTHGRITGVVARSDVDSELIPQLAVEFSALVARDCPGPGAGSCLDGSTGKTVESLFDTNADLSVTNSELLQNNLMKALLAPDYDLDHDGKKDGLSVGFGFGAVRAKLVR